METIRLGLGPLHRIREKLLAGFAAAVVAYAVLWFLVLSGLSTHGHAEVSSGAAHPAVSVPAWFSVLPFAALLGCIAVLPVLSKTAHWWEHNWNRLGVALGCAALTLAYYAFVYQGSLGNHLTHTESHGAINNIITVLANAWVVEYVPFLTLLFALYVISGGIVIDGRLTGRPSVNLALIGIGTLLASLVGTTGAAMLMIRPLLRANASRKYMVHTVVFFIFTVCNTGGCLLPIGDPPLFLGFLRGVNFGWTLTLWPMWLMMNGMLLVTYLIVDRFMWRKESDEARQPSGPPARIRLRGALNLVWLMGVVLAVATLDPGRAFPGTHWHPPMFYREIVILSFTACSLWLTRDSCREANAFNYDAILEVAALFLGIFICMQPAVQMLNVYGSQLGLDSPSKFFWATGLLSSCLDNAPTYVVFFETARTVPAPGAVVAGVPETFLIAISLGAVFLGAMTYIGNGPNLMIKAIAESQKVRMPSFFGYMAYSAAFMLPAAIVMTLIFLM